MGALLEVLLVVAAQAAGTLPFLWCLPKKKDGMYMLFCALYVLLKLPEQ